MEYLINDQILGQKDCEFLHGLLGLLKDVKKAYMLFFPTACSLSHFSVVKERLLSVAHRLLMFPTIAPL